MPVWVPPSEVGEFMREMAVAAALFFEKLGGVERGHRWWQVLEVLARQDHFDRGKIPESFLQLHALRAELETGFFHGKKLTLQAYI